MSPFALVFDHTEWAAAVASFTAGGWPAPGDVLVHLVAWLTMLFLTERLSPRRATALAIGAMSTVIAGRILFSGLGLESAEVAGMAASMLLARMLAGLSRPRAAALLAAALLALIAWQGLAPFDFQLAPDRFAFLPFSESLMQYRASNLADMFLRVFTNGALVWLLFQAGLSALVATCLGAGAVFAIELVQTWLPAQTAEITDPLLAVCAGGLMAVFEREGEP